MEDMVNQTSTRPKRLFGNKKQLENDLQRLNQEIYKHSIELAETNRTLSLLRVIDNLVLDSRDELDELCQKITNAFMTLPNYLAVGLLASSVNSRNYKLMGWSTSSDAGSAVVIPDVLLSVNNEFVSGIEKTLIYGVENLDMAKVSALLGIQSETLANLHQQLPVKSIVITKLMSRYRIVGLMAFCFAQDEAELESKEMELVERMSEAVGIALDNKLLFDENKRVLGQLQKTNQKLKEMDETKDEFISMASHQLRTPLTSVKGYLSMVLEGDVGTIPEMQRKLLDQAFVSSQRMVYLIADLLNVSRLRTGKFIIEQVPTNLANVAEEESKQLIETAKARKLELIYNKPENFPAVMLDETKIRQVVMNFMDNAIYYTPSGGHITVEVKDTGKAVEYTVTDDGLGVPKWDQPHLFTKFYRAGNAKKARPDGTGLGLFMAKKVVVAQGGSIIFKSEEGKGSTFGFSFDKDKLQQMAEEQSKKEEVTHAKPTDLEKQAKQ